MANSILALFCFYLGHHSMTNDLVSPKKDLYCNFVFPSNSSLVLGPELQNYKLKQLKNISTPDFSTMNFPTPWFKTFMVEKSGVERSGVETQG